MAIAHAKARIQLQRLSGLWLDARFDVEQYDFIHQADLFGRAVIRLHQQFCAGARTVPLQAECLGEFHLMIKQQPVFASVRAEMQADA